MVTKFVFLQDFSGFSKNGQKKCPKMKIRKYFWKKNKVNIINFQNNLKKRAPLFKNINAR
jgi:glutaredoxin 2